MPDYLPLCAFRQELLPVACRSCAWWQTTGSGPKNPELAGERRRQWMTSLEPTWGSTGLLLAGNGPAPARAPAAGVSMLRAAPARVPHVVASISYAPAAAVPRLRDLPFAPLPVGAVLLFCLRSEGNHGRRRRSGCSTRPWRSSKNERRKKCMPSPVSPAAPSTTTTASSSPSGFWRPTASSGYAKTGSCFSCVPTCEASCRLSPRWKHWCGGCSEMILPQAQRRGRAEEPLEPGANWRARPC